MHSTIDLDLCFMCTKDYNCVLVDNRIICQVEYLLPEITIIKLGIPLRICSLCEGALYAFNKFKQFYIESSRRLEASIKGAQGPPIHTDSPQFVDNKQTLNVITETTEETSFEEEISTEISQTTDTEPKPFESIFIIKEEQFTELPQTTNTCDEMVQSSWNEVGNDPQTENKDGSDTSSLNLIENIEIDTNNSTNINKTSENVKKREFPCKICNKIFYKSYNLKRHMTMHSNKLSCQLCKAVFNCEQDLTCHIKYKHDQNLIPEQNQTTTNENCNLKKQSEHDKQNSCPVCKKIFENKLEMNNHVKSMHAYVSRYIISDAEVKDLSTFENEIETNETNLENSNLKENECHICHKIFAYASNLKRHMSIHTGENKFACKICNKLFARKAYVDCHIERIHMTKNKIPCSICNKTFKHQFDLKDHMKLHTGVKNYYCNICDKKLMRKSSLEYHIKVHSGVKDVQCKICNKSFTHITNLQGHMRSHKPHACDVCKKSFVHKENLVEHMKIHSKVKDFQCEICKKCFGHKRKLIRHMKVHEKNKNV